MGLNKPSISKVPSSDLKDMPDEAWSNSMVASINQALLASSGSNDNIEIKTVDLTTPDPWTAVTFQNAWAGKGGKIKYMRHYDGSVQVIGFATGGVYGTTCFSLGDQLDPSTGFDFLAYCATAPNVARWNVATAASFIPVGGAGNVSIQVRYMPKNNRPAPLKCFPVNVSTKFKSPPKAVLCLRNEKVGETTKKPTSTAMLPAWRYINGPDGPTVQITDIPGLEYGCRQRVTVAIIGG